MKKGRITIVIVLISIVLITSLIVRTNKKYPGFDAEMKQAYKTLKEKEFIGTVISVEADKANHYFKTVFYKDSIGRINRFIVEYDLSNLYNNILIGDSIIKKRGDYFVRVISEQNDTLFYLDYGSKYSD